MPGNSFLKIHGEADCKGESVQKGYIDHIEIDDFSWEITSDTSFTKGGGASVGKATPGTCSWKHYYDTASPYIMLYCVQGKSFSKVEINMLKQDGGATPKMYFKMVCEDVFITKATIEAGEDGSVNQQVEMVFKNVEIEYHKQDNKSNKILDEKKMFKWSVPAMEATTG